MTLRLTCQNCKKELTGDDEDELVASVQEHVAGHSQEHGVSHTPSREHILHRLHRQQAKEAAGKQE